MKYRVRRAKGSDAPAACEAVRQSITALCVEDHRADEETLAAWLSNKTVENFSAWFASDRHIALVAEGDTGVAGCGLLTHEGKIVLLYVSPAARFWGVRKALLTSLEREAVAVGVRDIHLSSTATAKRFYESCGYRSCGEPEKGFGVIRSYPMSKQVATY